MHLWCSTVRTLVLGICRHWVEGYQKGVGGWVWNVTEDCTRRERNLSGKITFMEGWWYAFPSVYLCGGIKIAASKRYSSNATFFSSLLDDISSLGTSSTFVSMWGILPPRKLLLRSQQQPYYTYYVEETSYLGHTWLRVILFFNRMFPNNTVFDFLL